jgi:hypothetical protein
MANSYPELEAINREFLRALRADPKPMSNSALFWHEGLEFDRNPEAPRVRSRGDAFLLYLREHKGLDEVPGQQFAQDKLPMEVCAAVMTKYAPSPTGPRLITFRYDRSADGRWDGGCSIETQAQYVELVKGRKELDERMAEALRGYFNPGIEAVELLYGLRRWDKPGPKLGLDRGQVKDFVDVEGELAKTWVDLVDYLSRHGVKHIYNARFTLEKPKSRLRDGQNARILYSL